MKLRVFTMNCWGIAYAPMMSSPKRKERMKAIARHLASDMEDKYDIVCLQEVWTESDQELIKAACKQCLPFSITFFGGLIGSGTMLMSRWPIQETNYHEFSMNGFLHHFWHGDAFAGSGIGMAQVLVDYNLRVNVYVSHYHAEYSRQHDPHLADRTAQALEAGEWIDVSSKDADVVVYCGDFNTEPGDLPHEVLTTLFGLADAHKHAYDPLPTCYHKENTYRLHDGNANPREVTIDYIMYKTPFAVEVNDVTRPLDHPVPGSLFSHSDHEALAATIEVYSEARGGRGDRPIRSQIETNRCNEYRDQLQVLKKARDVFHEEIDKSRWWELYHVSTFVLLLAILLCIGVFCMQTESFLLGLLAGLFFGSSLLATFLVVVIYHERRYALRSTQQILDSVKGKVARRFMQK